MRETAQRRRRVQQAGQRQGVFSASARCLQSASPDATASAW
jgi:hypothetical protein